MHPGLILQKKFLTTSKMSIKQLAVVSGIHEVVIIELLEGNWPITNEVAHGLSKAFHNSTSYWIELQKNYDDSTLSSLRKKNSQSESLNGHTSQRVSL